MHVNAFCCAHEDFKISNKTVKHSQCMWDYDLTSVRISIQTVLQCYTHLIWASLFSVSGLNREMAKCSNPLPTSENLTVC